MKGSCTYIYLRQCISTCVSTNLLIRQIFSFYSILVCCLENVYYTTHKILKSIREVEAWLIIPVLQLHLYKYYETRQLFIKHSKQYSNAFRCVSPSHTTSDIIPMNQSLTASFNKIYVHDKCI